jgi:hypothetical protein
MNRELLELFGPTVPLGGDNDPGIRQGVLTILRLVQGIRHATTRPEGAEKS